MPGATATTVAGTLSPAAFAWTCTWLAYSTTCALVSMRLPSMTTPEALTSRRRLLGPGLERIRIAHGREHFHHRIFDAPAAARLAASAAQARGKRQTRAAEQSTEAEKVPLEWHVVIDVSYLPSTEKASSTLPGAVAPPELM